METTSIDTLVYEAAKRGDMAFVQEHKDDTRYTLDMGIMGATDGGQKAIQDYCFSRGACLLWSIPHSFGRATSSAKEKGDSFFTRVSMIKGPGDIAKGQFSGGPKA